MAETFSSDRHDRLRSAQISDVIAVTSTAVGREREKERDRDEENLLSDEMAATSSDVRHDRWRRPQLSDVIGDSSADRRHRLLRAQLLDVRAATSSTFVRDGFECVGVVVGGGGG